MTACVCIGPKECHHQKQHHHHRPQQARAAGLSSALFPFTASSTAAVKQDFLLRPLTAAR